MNDIASSNVEPPQNVDITDSKPWYLSRGFIGPLSTAVLFALRQTGIVDLDNDATANVVYSVAEFAGLVIGMFGRARADKRLRIC